MVDCVIKRAGIPKVGFLIKHTCVDTLLWVPNPNGGSGGVVGCMEV